MHLNGLLLARVPFIGVVAMHELAKNYRCVGQVNN
jgi:hypothetical protein